MKNQRRIIGIVAATLLALIGTVSLVGYVRSARDEAVAQESLVDVYIVDAFVPEGAEPATILSSVSLDQVPARLLQDGAITELDDVGDNVAAADLQPGDQLVSARLASRDVVFVEITDKVQISARLDAERAVGGALQEGDLVGVYLSFEPFDVTQYEFTVELDDGQESGVDPESDPGRAAAGVAGDDVDPTITATAAADQIIKTPNVTRMEFQHVLVTSVQTVSAPVIGDGIDDEDAGLAQITGNQYVVTLAMSPEQSERFVFAKEFGNVWLSLDPASVADDGTRTVTLDEVYAVVK